jgi:hypothetical protein
MDPRLLQILQALGMNPGAMGGGMGAMGAMGMPQMQPPMQSMVRQTPGMPMQPGGGHQLSIQSLLGGLMNQQQQPGQTPTGPPMQSAQGPPPGQLPPGIQQGITQAQSPPPLQAAQGPGVQSLLGFGAQQPPAQPQGWGSVLSGFGNTLSNWLNPQTPDRNQAENLPANPMAFDPGQHSLKLGSLIAAAIAA